MGNAQKMPIISAAKRQFLVTRTARDSVCVANTHPRHRAWLVGFAPDMIRLTSKAQGPARMENKTKQILR
jgi:hypothetical protein